MRFFLDEGIAPAASEVIRRHGHESVHARDAGLKGQDDAVLAAYALERGLAIITLDFGFGDVRAYPPGRYHGIVVLQPPVVTNRALTLRLMDQVVSNEVVIRNLPGRLVIAAFGLIRLRPPLS